MLIYEESVQSRKAAGHFLSLQPPLLVLPRAIDFQKPSKWRWRSCFKFLGGLPFRQSPLIGGAPRSTLLMKYLWVRFSQIVPILAPLISIVGGRRVHTGQPTQSCHQSCKTRPIFAGHSFELHTHPATGFHVTYNGVGTYLAFVDKKVKICDSSNRSDLWRFEEEPSHAHIPHR